MRIQKHTLTCSGAWVQGTDGLAGSLCSVSGAAVSGYKFTPCKDNLLCAPLASGTLAGTGVGYCNTTKGGDVSPSPL